MYFCRCRCKRNKKHQGKKTAHTFWRYRHRLWEVFRQTEELLRQCAGVTLNRTKPHAVNFYYYGIEVDLLVSPNWPNLGALWTFLQDVDREYLFE